MGIKKVLSMATFRRKMGCPLSELRHLAEMGYVEIQQSGFIADSLHHHKIVVFNPKTIQKVLKLSSEKHVKYAKKVRFIPEGKNIYVRNMPTPLYNRLKKLKSEFGETWTLFFYEVDRIVTEYLRNKKGMEVS